MPWSFLSSLVFIGSRFRAGANHGRAIGHAPVWTVGSPDHTLVILASPETERGPGPRVSSPTLRDFQRRRLEGNGRPAMVSSSQPHAASSELPVPCSAPGGLRPIIPKRARPTRPPPRGGTARLPHVGERKTGTPARTLKERTMRLESMELQHVVFETEERRERVDAMWSDVASLHAANIPDGWHCYASGAATVWMAAMHLRGKNLVWVNQAGDDHHADDLDPACSKGTGGCSSAGTGAFTDDRSGARNAGSVMEHERREHGRARNGSGPNTTSSPGRRVPNLAAHGLGNRDRRPTHLDSLHYADHPNRWRPYAPTGIGLRPVRPTLCERQRRIRRGRRAIGARAAWWDEQALSHAGRGPDDYPRRTGLLLDKRRRLKTSSPFRPSDAPGPMPPA